MQGRTMNNKLTVAYVLVYRGTGRYATMAYLSVLATRRVQPDVRVVIICDSETVPHVRANSPALFDNVDEVIVVDSGIDNLRARSFHLKTRVRDFIAGDLIYLDSDTLPIRPFRDMADGNWDIALVQDRNHHCPVTPVYPHWELDRMKQMGWDCPLPKYFNAGVYFFRDNPAVRAVVADWQRRWQHSWSLGDDWDQLALNCSLHTLPVRVRELPPAYNAMVTVSPLHARGAKIYHFFAGNRETLDDSLYEHLIKHCEATGEIDWEAIDRCKAIDHPWMCPYWPRRLWQTGNRSLAIQVALQRVPARLSAVGRSLCASLVDRGAKS
jgi:hypothetical protein